MEDYCTFEQALRLKELGFDWECFFPYTDGKIVRNHPCPINWNNHGYTGYELISAPTLAQAQKWLREVKGIYVEISRYGLNNFAYELKFDYDSNHRYCCQAYMTPEEALSAGLYRALELLK